MVEGYYYRKEQDRRYLAALAANIYNTQVSKRSSKATVDKMYGCKPAFDDFLKQPKKKARIITPQSEDWETWVEQLPEKMRAEIERTKLWRPSATSTSA